MTAANEAAIKRGAQLLRSGGIVAFPTETVYGLGANAFDPKAVARIFEAKERPEFDPLIVHIGDASELSRVARSDDPVAQKLMQQFWPGPLTLVLPKHEDVPGIVTSGLDTVAVRVPSHTVAHQLIVDAGVPIAAPSANKFGALSPTRAQHVIDGLGDAVDFVLDGGATTWGLESTIVSVINGVVTLLRPGAVSLEDLQDVVTVEVSDGIAVTAPGQLEQHYSPNTKLKMINRGEAFEQTERTIYLAFNARPPKDDAIAVKFLSENGDLREAAANLFDMLHQLDAMNADQIIAEWLPERGLGRAMNDRLRRAAAKFR